MSTAFLFRASAYLTLILGSICLGYSEWDYLPEASAFTAVIVALMAVAFVMDLRGRHLSLDQANAAGLVIFLLAGAWLYVHYRQPESLMHTLPWPAGGLPFLGPLLMLLIAAKLFRPKHQGDWWALYCISLASVGLAMSLAEDIIFVGLVLLYAVCAVWSLSLFQFHRTAEDSPARDPRLKGAVSYLPRAVAWSAAAGLIAAPMFFLTPRTSGVQWELFKAKMETGLPLDGSPDLSRTGTLNPSSEVAFEVEARGRNGRPKTDLPADQRWRGPSYTEYASPRGRWARPGGPAIIAPMDNIHWRSTREFQQPDYGPDSFELEFRLVSRLAGPVFADPVVFDQKQQSPIAVPIRTGFGYALQNWDASFVFPHREVRAVNRYVQTTRGRGPDGSEPISSFPLIESFNPFNLLITFVTPPPPGIEDYTRGLIDRLSREGRISARARSRMTAAYRFHPLDHAEVAEAFRNFLADSGQFTYTLELRRENRTLDPIEDFLRNTRSGHCERFASALVLMLRSAGIPSQLVLGFLGCEQVEDGRYLVYQNNAHAWAEVLLSRPGRDGRSEWHWQVYDPTPTGADNTPTGFMNLGAFQGKRLLADYIIGLNPDTQRRLAESVGTFLSESWPVVAGASLVAIAIPFALPGLRRRWRNRKQRAAATDPIPWYTRMRAMLASAGLPGAAGETAREFAERARNWLGTRNGPAEVAVLIDRATALHQSVRYAGEPTVPQDIQAIERDLDRHEADIAALRRTKPGEQ